MIETENQGQMIVYQEGWSQEKVLKEYQEAWLKAILADDEWDLSGKFADTVVEGLFAHSTQLNTKSIKIRWNDMSAIIKDIESISFPHLQELYLNGNNIVSIEAFPLMNMPNLRDLNLKQNMISSLDCLRKCQLPQLLYLSCYKNTIRASERVSEMRGPSLKKVWINAEMEAINSQNNIDSLAWILKLESTELSACFVWSKNMVKRWSQTLQDKVKNKYPRCKTQYRITDDQGLGWL